MMFNYAGIIEDAKKYDGAPLTVQYNTTFTLGLR